MTIGSRELIGRVTFVTGPDKGSGKTALMNYSLGLLRRAGEAPAYLGVGLDGDCASLGGASTIPCMPGELFLSAERYLRASGCECEIMAVLPGSGALGRLAIARSRRPGLAVLVGPERNELVAAAIGIMRGELGYRTVLVDGSMNRITQVSSLSGARFYFAMSVGPRELESRIRSMRRLAFLSGLKGLGDAARIDPDSAASAAGLPLPASYEPGPLTGLSLSRRRERGGTILVDDFTKVFLGWEELRSLVRTGSLAVVHGIDFGGFVLRLRDISRAAFSAALADPAIEALIAYNPYEASFDGGS